MIIFNPRILWLALLVIPWVLILFPLYHYQKKNYLLLGGKLEKLDIFFANFSKYWMCIIGIFLSIVLSWGDIAIGNKLVRKNLSGLQIIIAMDVSNSMRATDVLPSRLVAGQNLARSIIYGLDPVQAGFVFFKGEAVVGSPLTEDKDFLSGIISNVQADTLTAPGTNIANAIMTAKGLFSTSSDTKKVIILLSDGAQLSGDLLKSLREANAEGVTIISVGLGSLQGIQIPSLSITGQTIFSKLESFSLKTAAQSTNGIYLPYDSNTSTEIISYLDNYNEVASHLEKEPNRLRDLFLLVALALVGLSLWLRSSQWKKYFTI